MTRQRGLHIYKIFQCDECAAIFQKFFDLLGANHDAAARRNAFDKSNGGIFKCASFVIGEGVIRGFYRIEQKFIERAVVQFLFGVLIDFCFCHFFNVLSFGGECLCKSGGVIEDFLKFDSVG